METSPFIRTSPLPELARKQVELASASDAKLAASLAQLETVVTELRAESAAAKASSNARSRTDKRRWWVMFIAQLITLAVATPTFIAEVQKLAGH